MHILELIETKKQGRALSKEQIEFFVKGAVQETVPDYQLSALLMAICLKGMTPEETTHLTLALMHSGDTLDLSGIRGVVADKHSTGGVGDTTTLLVVPLAAACGASMAKMSGRGLGHTGGTIDKLEAIPGFQAQQSISRFKELVNQNGAALVGQTGNLCPGDKRLYALRDVTGTVDSLPLIASSVMSKKLAAGAQVLVLDVKVGSGAFMKTLEDARSLARQMVQIAKQLDRKATAFLTDMDAPLGRAVGNALEVKEALDILSNRRKHGALREVSLLLAQSILVMTGCAKDDAQAQAQLEQVLSSGAALEKLRTLITAQGGEGSVVDRPDLLPTAREIIPVTANQEGYITGIDALALGKAARMLGAGRVRMEDEVDPAVGVVLSADMGAYIRPGDLIAQLHVNCPDNAQEALEQVQAAFKTGPEPVQKPAVLGCVS